MTDKLKEFNDYRAKMNARILSEDNRVVKRVFSVDSLVFSADSSLPKSTKELLGLVSSLVLRCDDCVNYHIEESVKSGMTHEQIVEAMSVGLVVGGTIVIPHMRKAVEFLDEVEAVLGAN